MGGRASYALTRNFKMVLDFAATRGMPVIGTPVKGVPLAKIKRQRSDPTELAAAVDAVTNEDIMRMGVRIGHGRDHQGRAAHQRQARFHHVAADDAVAFGGVIGPRGDRLAVLIVVEVGLMTAIGSMRERFPLGGG